LCIIICSCVLSFVVVRANVCKNVHQKLHFIFGKSSSSLCIGPVVGEVQLREEEAEIRREQENRKREEMMREGIVVGATYGRGSIDDINGRGSVMSLNGGAWPRSGLLRGINF
jgi:hypothetical protein